MTLTKLSITDQISIGLQKDSEYKKVLNYQILKLKECGILQRLIKDSPWDHRKSRKRESAITAGTLGFENLLFPFILLGFGIGLGVILALQERVNHELVINKQ